LKVAPQRRGYEKEKKNKLMWTERKRKREAGGREAIIKKKSAIQEGKGKIMDKKKTTGHARKRASPGG